MKKRLFLAATSALAAHGPAARCTGAAEKADHAGRRLRAGGGSRHGGAADRQEAGREHRPDRGRRQPGRRRRQHRAPACRQRPARRLGAPARLDRPAVDRAAHDEGRLRPVQGPGATDDGRQLPQRAGGASGRRREDAGRVRRPGQGQARHPRTTRRPAPARPRTWRASCSTTAPVSTWCTCRTRAAHRRCSDLLAGRFAAYFSTPSTALPHIEAGKLIALATTGLERPAFMPQRADGGRVGLPRLRRRPTGTPSSRPARRRRRSSTAGTRSSSRC